MKKQNTKILKEFYFINRDNAISKDFFEKAKEKKDNNKWVRQCLYGEDYLYYTLNENLFNTKKEAQLKLNELNIERIIILENQYRDAEDRIRYFEDKIRELYEKYSNISNIINTYRDNNIIDTYDDDKEYKINSETDFGFILFIIWMLFSSAAGVLLLLNWFFK